MTVDITNTIEALRGAFVTWGASFITAAEIAIPGLAWLGLPVISSLNQALTRFILNLLSTSTILEAFFLNTALRKNGQAHDLIHAVEFKKNLPESATNEEYEDAEKAEMAAFRNFVLVTN